MRARVALTTDAILDPPDWILDIVDSSGSRVSETRARNYVCRGFVDFFPFLVESKLVRICRIEWERLIRWFEGQSF